MDLAAKDLAIIDVDNFSEPKILKSISLYLLAKPANAPSFGKSFFSEKLSAKPVGSIFSNSVELCFENVSIGREQFASHGGPFMVQAALSLFLGRLVCRDGIFALDQSFLTWIIFYTSNLFYIQSHIIFIFQLSYLPLNLEYSSPKSILEKSGALNPGEGSVAVIYRIVFLWRSYYSFLKSVLNFAVLLFYLTFPAR